MGTRAVATRRAIGSLMSTGDVGHFDAEGRLFVDGRDDDMIVSGGENVFPSEVEDLLSAVPGVAEVAVVGVPDPEFGQRLRAYVVPAPGAELSAEQLQAHVRANLARYKVPRDVEFIDELPRNATGKILKRALQLVTLRTDSFDLRGLRLSSGEGRRLELAVRSTGSSSAARPIRAAQALIAGAPRHLPDHRLRIRAAAAVRGPAGGPLHALSGGGRVPGVRGRRAARSPSPGEGDELESPYVDDGVLDLKAWAHDALALALPGPVLCRPDCAGLCPVCGETSITAGADHRHEREPDPRWAKLSELRFDSCDTLSHRRRLLASCQWPSPSRSNLTPAPRSAARRTRSAAPTYNACPQCHSPRRPHRVCPTCGSYRGREVVAGTTSRRAEPPEPMVTVAVDAGGADLGPARLRRARRGGAAGHQRAPVRARREIGAVPDGVEVVDAPVSIAKAAEPAFAVRSTPEASIVQAAKAVADGRAQALVSAGSTGSALIAGLFNLRRGRGIYRPALALPMPVPGHPPVLLLDVGFNTTCRPEHLVQFAHMGSAFSRAVLGVAGRAWRCSRTDEASRGRRSCSRSTTRWPGPAAPASTSSATSRARR